MLQANRESGKIYFNIPLRNEKAARHNVAVQFVSSLHPQSTGQISPLQSYISVGKHQGLISDFGGRDLILRVLLGLNRRPTPSDKCSTLNETLLISLIYSEYRAEYICIYKSI